MLHMVKVNENFWRRESEKNKPSLPRKRKQLRRRSEKAARISRPKIQMGEREKRIWRRRKGETRPPPLGREKLYSEITKSRGKGKRGEQPEEREWIFASRALKLTFITAVSESSDYKFYDIEETDYTRQLLRCRCFFFQLYK